MLEDQKDAFGHEMYDAFYGSEIPEISERDDGFINAIGPVSRYLDKYAKWPSIEKRAMTYVHGRVLDIGCGAGRHSLYLQDKGLDVVGIDASPLAIKLCRERGLRDARVMSIAQVNRSLGQFDTILMLGNNFGLFESPDRAKQLLKRLYGLTSRRGRIIAETRDPYSTDVPEHLEYHQMNKARGRMAGQVRMRIRYKKFATPWFDYLLVSKQEMNDILDGTGWAVKRFLESQSPTYIAIIEKLVKPEKC
jgi:SAM-dependent methyltransferase